METYDNLNERVAGLLISAIITQAIKDYEYGLKYLKVEATTSRMANKICNATRLYFDSERFFCSPWFGMMCNANGEEILDRMKKHYCEYSCSILSDENTKKKNKRKVKLTI